MHRLLTLAFLLLGFAAIGHAEELPPTLKLGAAAPDFSLPAVDGKTYSLKDFADAKLLVIVFTCNHCPTAQYYEERIKSITADYKDKGVTLIGIMPNDPLAVRLDELGWTDLNDSFAEMKVRAKDRAYNFPYLYDGDTQSVAHAYGPLVTPHAYVFDAERKLRYVGAIDNSERVQHVTKTYLRDALDALLAGEEPAVKETKVVGCSLKWSSKRQQNEEFLAKWAAEPVTLKPADEATLTALRKNGGEKFRLVNFWATWCAPCVAEFDQLVVINRSYRHRDFEVVSVSLNRPDEQNAVLGFLKKKEASFQNLIFSSAERDPLINAFNPKWQGVVPYTVLISPEGNVIYEETGSIDTLAVKRAIVKALNERKPW
jgi:peroxiredoxin